MSSAPTPLPFTVTRTIHTPKMLSLIPITPLPLSKYHKIQFPPLTRTFLVKSVSFSPQPLYDAVSAEQEEDDGIGDCLVYEEGIFDDPYLQANSKSPQTNKISRNNKSSMNIPPSPENLIPKNWLEIQKELNITKKERRKLAQESEYGRKVEGRRRALMPINSEVFEKFKNEKLKQLNPVVLDKPELKNLDDDKKDEEEEERSVEVVRGRVAGRNPRLAVYGAGLEDISELFSSGSYDPSASDNSKGTRQLFSKEEKLLLNRRVPNFAVATSGKWHPLHTLAATGEFYLVNSLLKHNIDINVPDKDGLTAIHIAILGKKQAIFNFLLRESANPFIRDEEGATLLHYAVFSASCHMIKILLLYNVDINLQDNDGWTALHLAVQSRRTDIVRLLLIKGADKTLKNRDGLTAVDICFYSGRDTRTYELLKLLKRLPKSSITQQ